MADMVGAAGAALSPLAALLHRELISRPVVHADETTLKILNTKKGGKSCSGYLWAYVSGERTGPSVVCFDCRTGRSHEYPENWLQGWGGTLVVDGHKAYRTLANKVPELANIIGHHAGIDDNTAAKAIAHAILGGVTAALQGNSAAAGAIGAGTGEVISSAIAKSLYPDVEPSKLTEDQKQTVSTLATLSAGMAGGIASGDVAGAAAGAGAGKNVVENNALSLVARGCAVAAPCRTKVAEQLLEIGAKAGMAGLAGAAVKDMADRMTSDELEHLITLQMMGNDEITTKYLSSLHDKYGSGAASNPNIGKDLTDAEKVELGGSGSGTGTPPPSENDPKQQNEKPVDKLNQKQESAIKKIDNTIKML